eukprot:TRINITY_DN4507_c0_g1_i1.p1 TRINITY_DN4507_c0_g1~~TRINITY_DN4507_c0_g1_i1.p1  ORF type:complete len:752 (-),score=187.77 TRINITY_DN4507_c0_g1_i1:11-2266(-)
METPAKSKAFWPAPEEVVRENSDWPLKKFPNPLGIGQVRAEIVGEKADEVEKMNVSNKAPKTLGASKESEESKCESPAPTGEKGPLEIGIIGAGISGMYSALLLRYLGIDSKITIYEANKTRVGGRCFTHYFDPEDAKKPETDPKYYKYVDIGGMRFPDLPNQFDLWRLIQFLNIASRGGFKGDYSKNNITGTKNPEIHLDYYFMKSKNADPELKDQETLNARGYFNNIWRPETSPDEKRDWYNFAFTGVPHELLTHYTATELEDKVFEKDLAALWEGYKHNRLKQTFEEILEREDLNSVRSKMSAQLPEFMKQIEANPPADKTWITHTVNYAETQGKATGMYDASYVDMLTEAFNFSPAAGLEKEDRFKYSWRLIRGGTSRLSDSVATWLRDRQDKVGIETGRIVIKIKEALGGSKIQIGHAETLTAEVDKQNSVDAEAGRSTETTTFDHVICTTTLPMLRTMQIDWALVNPSVNMALRSLRYEHSVKIGFAFTKRWWEDQEFMKTKSNHARVGGLATTDLHIRTIVFPSYGYPEWKPNHALEPNKELPGVMLVSYCWSIDADNLANLPEKIAVKKAYDNLLDVFQLDATDLDKFIDDKPQQKVGEKKFPQYKFFNWNNDAHALGAFAIFGPGQFSSLYPVMTRPAGTQGRLHFAGEALSTNHGWITGALSSAYRSVRAILEHEARGEGADGKYKKAIKKLEADWGPPEAHSEGVDDLPVVEARVSSRKAMEQQIHIPPTFRFAFQAYNA